jgi:hypothetical protein
MNVADDGLRQRSTAAVPPVGSTTAKQPDDTADTSDMAYGSGRNRPVLATSIRRTISSGLYSSNRVLRRYFNRILFVFAVTAIYTIYIYKSGAFCPFLYDVPHLSRTLVCGLEETLKHDILHIVWLDVCRGCSYFLSRRESSDEHKQDEVAVTYGQSIADRNMEYCRHQQQSV